MEAFSDGVFSIAATLLVLEIALVHRERHSNSCSTRGPSSSANTGDKVVG
jgi:uncharacterized membrane protein